MKIRKIMCNHTRTIFRWSTEKRGLGSIIIGPFFIVTEGRKR